MTQIIDLINLPWKERLKNNFSDLGNSIPKSRGAVHLFTPTLFFKDAVSRHVLELASALSLVAEVRIHAENVINDELKKHVTSWQDFLDHHDPENDILIYGYSIGTPTLKQAIEAPIRRKHAIYYGITPPEMVRSASPATAELCASGIRELPLLNQFRSWTANSNFVMNELRSIKSDPSIREFILPPYLTMDKWDDVDSKPNEQIRYHLTRQGQTRLTYVGRRAPNKNIQALIDILDKAIKLNRDYRLVIAGGGAMPEYHQLLSSRAAELGMTANVLFFDEPSDADLKFIYEQSHAVLSTSLHEGFCVPLVEAIKFRRPTFIFNRTAMPETLGQHSLLLDESSPAKSAALIHSILFNPDALEGYVRKLTDFYESTYSDGPVTRRYADYIHFVLNPT